MNRCSHCGDGFRPTRPRCECPICRNTQGPQIKCIRCCYAINPDIDRESVYVEQLFLCHVCLSAVSATKCPCCTKAVLCDVCCGDYTHRCCSPTPIRFRHGTLRFGYPCLAKDQHDRKVGWLDTQNSEELFTAPSGVLFKVDLHGFDINSSNRFAAVEFEILNCV